MTARGDAVAVAWFTQARGVPLVQLARSDDGGASFGAPRVLQRGATLGRVDVVALGPDLEEVLVSHVTRVGRAYRLLVTQVRGSRAERTLRVADLGGGRADGFPRMAPVAGMERTALVGWTDRTGADPRVALALVGPPAGAGPGR